MERPSPEPLDARGLKTPTSDRAKRFLLNSFLKSAEACSLLMPVQKEECSLLHLFSNHISPRPLCLILHSGFISEVPQTPCIQGDLSIVLQFPCLAALKITLYLLQTLASQPFILLHIAEWFSIRWSQQLFTLLSLCSWNSSWSENDEQNIHSKNRRWGEEVMIARV